MGDDGSDAATALWRLAAAQVELHAALERLSATCERTAAEMRGTALGSGRLHPDLAAHPDLVELDALLTRLYG
ncbi:hypothetical protein [uncultured Cellulomonas sp.]|uniref:hypothetical protein n=1 Tax=uncultured Cellulomonas sp. TaxID=189682 RepID=UPI002611F452|nr:hypothetical protein [uncultured Cellulomonas sp.]